jgi:hypothetical protein
MRDGGRRIAVQVDAAPDDQVAVLFERGRPDIPVNKSWQPRVQ